MYIEGSMSSYYPNIELHFFSNFPKKHNKSASLKILQKTQIELNEILQFVVLFKLILRQVCLYENLWFECIWGV